MTDCERSFWRGAASSSGHACFDPAAKVPFPLTLRFKPMLQRGIDLLSLDASWYAAQDPWTGPASCWLTDMFVLHTQGELGVLVLPERVWPEEHVQPHPGPGQWWVPTLWTTSCQSLIQLGF